jgi:hypothetical protein
MFHFKLWKIALEMHEMLKTTFDDNASRKTQTSAWFSQLKCGGNSVVDCEHLNRPSTAYTDENVEKVRKITNKDGQTTILEITGL